MSVNWSTYSTWDLVLPPNRPSEYLLQCLKLALTASEKIETVCILGSTPEYRLACHELNIPNVTIIDKSEEFSNYCDSLSVSNSRENKIFGDWIEILPQFTDNFDAVLSHLTHGNIHFNHRVSFFNAIRKSLRPDGLLIDYIFQPQNSGYTIDNIINLFKERLPNIRTYNDFNCMAIFQSDLIKQLGLVDTNAIYKYLNNMISNDHIKLIIEGTKKITPPNNTWFYAFDKPPHIYNYFDGYTKIATLPEDVCSPFHNAGVLSILRKT